MDRWGAMLSRLKRGSYKRPYAHCSHLLFRRPSIILHLIACLCLPYAVQGGDYAVGRTYVSMQAIPALTLLH